MSKFFEKLKQPVPEFFNAPLGLVILDVLASLVLAWHVGLLDLFH